MNMNSAGSQRNNQRKKMIVDPSYQMRYTVFLIILSTSEIILFAAVLVAAIFSIVEISSADHVRLFYYLMAVSAGMLLVLNLMNGLVGILFSHRISGPVYRFSQMAKTIGRGDFSPVIMLRKADELQELKDGLNEMLDGLRGRVREQNQLVVRMEELVRQEQARKSLPGGSLEFIPEMLQMLEKLKVNFKI